MPVDPLSDVVAHLRRLGEADLSGLTDRELIERFLSGWDEAAFAALVRRHGPMVLATCRQVLRHQQDAEDAFQAAFLVLARKSGSIRQRASVGGWLHEVAYRIAVRARTLNARRCARLTALIDEPPAPCPDPRQEASRLSLNEELARLSESYRSVIVLCYLEGRTQSEAAQLLGTTPEAVNSRLKRARQLLRLRLARQGAVLAAAALGAGRAQAALAPTLLNQTTRVAILFMTQETPLAGASTGAVALAQGVLKTMIPAKCKWFSALILLLALMGGALLVPSSAQEGSPENAPPASKNAGQPSQPKREKAQKQRHCILVWLSGGPSQIDTFDPKPGHVALCKAIDTSVKDVQFSETLPLLARQAKHLAIVRGVTHRFTDHTSASHLMQTGFEPGAVEYPTIGSVLGKELGDDAPGVPRLVRCGGGIPLGTHGPGILGRKYGALPVAGLAVPPLDAFETLEPDKDKAAAMRNAVVNAFDLSGEKKELRDSYGRGRFGASCLLARRLIEAGVPVVEIILGGWDAHADAAAVAKRVGGDLDAGLAALIQDLHEKKLLDSTAIVCMGEFGRTPAINGNGGRGHWPWGFSVVLAGRGIRAGQAIGKTSADGTKVEDRPVSPQELFATIYQALGIDPTKKYRTPGGDELPLVEGVSQAVKDALR